MGRPARVEAKRLGLLILVTSVLLLFVTWSFAIRFHESSMAHCQYLPGGCPGHVVLPAEVYIGTALLLVLVFAGTSLAFTADAVGTAGVDKEQMERTIKLLGNSDERRLYETLVESGGATFQSELVERMGLNKVKVSRVLDRLEGRGLIERRRRGMTNMVILKCPTDTRTP